MCICKYSHYCANKLIGSDNTSWSYSDQEQWKTYQNYYSVYKTPINIETHNISTGTDKLVIKYKKDVKGIVVNDHLTPYFFPNDGNNFVINNGIRYTLINYHLHNSSENTVDGAYSPVEVHMVNDYVDPAGVSHILV